MDYLTLALVLFGFGVLLLLVEVMVPTGGIVVALALVPFAVGVGIIMYYGSTIEAAVALLGLGIGLPAMGYLAVSAWSKMSLDRALDEPTAVEAAATEADALKGRTGKTVSPMRPSGTVEIDGRRIDAMTEGTMLDAGVWVRCVDVKRGQVIVRQMDEPPDAPGVEPVAEPKAAPPASEEPRRDEPKKPRDDFDDFDIGLSRT